MGQNPCKHLIEHGQRIGEPELESLLQAYDKDQNGVLDRDETERFLKDLCKALKTPYNKHNAARIVHRCDKNQNGTLDMQEFKTLFLEALNEAEVQGSAKARQLSNAALPGLSQPSGSAAPPAPAGKAPAVPEVEEVAMTPKEQRYHDAFSGPSKIDRDEIKLEKQIGKGQFGEVYIGTCRGMETAIKIPNLTLGGAKFDMLLNELEIMKKANNPHVCMFMGACHDASTDKILIVMELMDGDAEKKCKEEGHSLATRLDWVRQSCMGQAWLHDMSQPILHLDLKPSNILYDQRGVFKVCDFGLSAVLPEGEKELFMRRMRGTPIYMAPEIMVPGQDPISSKSDTYSMAITAWEMCTGKNCFSEYKSLAPFKRDVHLNGKRPPMPDTWPPSLQQLMSEMWHREPQKRPEFKDIVARLGPIIDEVKKREAHDKLISLIRDEEAVEWWQKEFLDKESVDWEVFAPALYKVLGKPLPDDPSALGDNPDQWKLMNATMAELERYGSKGDIQKAVVEAEHTRRLQSASVSSSSDGGSSIRARPPTPVNLSKEQQELMCLKTLLGFSTKNEEGVVDALRLGQYLSYLGPLDANFSKRLVELACQEYFHGFIPSARAESLLAGSSDGTFLVRFSENRWGQIIISVKNGSNNTIAHCVIENKDRRFRYKRKEDKWWDSVPLLVAAHKQVLNLCHPKEGGPVFTIFCKAANPIVGYGDDFNESDDDDY